MHFRLEVVMPPVVDVYNTLVEILAPFNEDRSDVPEDEQLPTFWDWCEIGGRWSGRKLTDQLPPAQLAMFQAALDGMQVTVSAVSAGKPTLSPASQIPVVDQLWRDHFPDSSIKVCPFFNHAGAELDGNIMTLGELDTSKVTCARVIICGPSYDGTKLVPEYMVSERLWNGVNYIDTKWDGTLSAALAEYTNRMSHYTQAYVDSHTPQPNWLVVTVDYHS